MADWGCGRGSPERRFKLVEVIAGEPSVLSESEPVTFWRGWAFRLVLRNSASGSEFRVKIGSTEVCGAGAALSVCPKEIWIGSSPAGDDQAPGLYSLSRTFGEALTDEELELELDFLPD
ncbi:MAG TPA: hypothetical protein VM487_20710 [Phycisphaerae bacterium]|nr:hypothetical protein [Phycisphaerae bacterium]